MPLNTIYRHSFKEMGVRYRLEMFPAAPLTTTPALTAPDYEDLPKNVVRAELSFSGSYRDDMPLGLPEATECTLTLNLTDAPADFKEYIDDPEGVGAVIFKKDGETLLLYGDVNGLFLFTTSNVWTIYSDLGDATLDPSAFTVIYQGVQKPAESVSLSGNTVKITLQDIGFAVLSQLHPSVLSWASVADELIAVSDTVHHVTGIDYDPWTWHQTFDIMYEDGDGVAFAVRSSPPVAKDADGVERNQWAILYTISDVYTMLHECAKALYTCFMRQPVTLSVTGSPLSALTFYEQDYTISSGRGDALAEDEIYTMGWIQNVAIDSSIPDHTEFIGGLFHRDDENGIEKNYSSLYDWLHDHAESSGTRAIIKNTDPTTLSIRYTTIENADTPTTFTLSNFVGTGPADVETEVRFNRIRGCTAGVMGMNANSVTQIEALSPYTRLQNDYTLKAPLHNLPMYVPDVDVTEYDQFSNDKQAVIDVSKFYCNRLYYLGAPSFSTSPSAVFVILVHRSPTWNDGTATTDISYTPELPDSSGMPTLPSWIPDEPYIREKFKSLVNVAVLQIQVNNNSVHTVARGLATKFSQKFQTQYSGTTKFASGGDSIAGQDNLGSSITFDGTTELSTFYTSLPSACIMTGIDVDIIANRSKIKLLGLP